jgi:hypothetical protein
LHFRPDDFSGFLIGRRAPTGRSRAAFTAGVTDAVVIEVRFQSVPPITPA